MIIADGRSHFSLGESLLTPSELVQSAAKHGVKSIILTDTMRISGMPEFFGECKKQNIKGIIGARLRMVDTLFSDRESKKKYRYYFLRVIVRDKLGYQALLRLLSRSFDEEHFYEVPRLLLSDVAEIMQGSGCVVTMGDFYSAVAAGRAQAVIDALMPVGIEVAYDVPLVPTAHFVRLAHEALTSPLVPRLKRFLSIPTLYDDAAHAGTLDLALAISRNLKFDERSAKHPYQGYLVQDNAGMLDRIRDMGVELTKRYGSSHDWHALLGEAWKDTVEETDHVTYEWHKEKPSLPIMATDEFRALVDGCMEGWKKRFSAPVFGHIPTDLEPYKVRLAYELGVLRKLHFEAYFLLVSKIVVWSKSQGIRVGPGRGSSAGSLVAYLMGITDVDPLRFNLLFERFINPERIDLPDADLDFASIRRTEVVKWITETFGAQFVAAVSNYTTMAGAGALKDVSSKLGVEDRVAFGKLVPKEHGQPIALDEALKTVPELDKFQKDYPEIVGHARILEDRMRSYGTHAAGVIVAGVPLEERCVVETRKGERVINWDKSLAEYFGLVKIDVLGLSTLDTIDIALRHIFRSRGLKLEPEHIPLDDPETLEAFGLGHCAGVFQFEAAYIRKVMKQMAVSRALTFDDLAALNALNRPGPMDAGLVDMYVDRRSGFKAVTYLHPLMQKGLEPTYGVIVFQESVMQISRELCGFTGSEADVLRKAIGKKSASLMAEQKDKFISGAIAGQVEVELDDGRIVWVHAKQKINVEESEDRFTIQEIFDRGLSPKL